jgi:hypothetical protein
MESIIAVGVLVMILMMPKEMGLQTVEAKCPSDIIAGHLAQLLIL